MTNRATLHMAALTALIAVGGSAVYAKGEGAFARIDADGNGQITQAEMAAHAKARFDKADANGDGALSSEEMAAQGAERRAKRMAKMMKRVDADGDGKVTFAEMTAKRDPARMFGKLDADGDGVLSEDEFAKARHMRKGKRNKASTD